MRGEFELAPVTAPLAGEPLAAKAGVSSGSGTGIPSISSISTARDRSHEGCPRASLTSGSPPPTCGEGMAPW